MATKLSEKARKNKIEYNKQYEKENKEQIKLTFNKKTEQQLLEHIKKQPNKQGYIKELIKKDIEAGK